MSELEWLRKELDDERAGNAILRRDFAVEEKEVERLRAELDEAESDNEQWEQLYGKLLKAKVEATPLTETTSRMLEAEARVAELEAVLDALHEGTTKGGSCSPSEDS